MKTKEELELQLGENIFELVMEDDSIYKLNREVAEKLGIEPSTIIVQDIEEDGRYYDELDIIAIGLSLCDSDYEIKKIIYHELRHKWQKSYYKSHNDKLALEFKKDFDDKAKTGVENPLSILELDAYWFQRKMLLELDHVHYKHPNDLMNVLINAYAKTYKEFLK